MKQLMMTALAVALAFSALPASAGPSQQEIEQAFDTLRQATRASESGPEAGNSRNREIKTEYLSLDDLKSLLRREGYRTIEEVDNKTILFSRDDIKYLLKRYDDGDLQLYYGLTGVRITFTDCNDWNRQRRLSRAYIDSDGDAVLEADLLGSGGINRNIVKEFVKVFITISVPKYKEFVRERDRTSSQSQDHSSSAYPI